jgi:CheY-like chemotaxis protein
MEQKPYDAVEPTGFLSRKYAKVSAMRDETTASGLGKILVIDDNLVIQKSVYFTLRDHGYQVLMTGDISEAMKILRREKLDLVLVDLSFPLDAGNINGPLQDGFYVIDWILRTPEVSKPPIIIISSSKPAEYQERAAAAGVRACFQKPLDKEKLLASVQSILGNKN